MSVQSKTSLQSQVNESQKFYSIIYSSFKSQMDKEKNQKSFSSEFRSSEFLSIAQSKDITVREFQLCEPQQQSFLEKRQQQQVGQSQNKNNGILIEKQSSQNQNQNLNDNLINQNDQNFKGFTQSQKNSNFQQQNFISSSQSISQSQFMVDDQQSQFSQSEQEQNARKRKIVKNSRKNHKSNKENLNPIKIQTYSKSYVDKNVKRSEQTINQSDEQSSQKMKKIKKFQTKQITKKSTKISHKKSKKAKNAIKKKNKEQKKSKQQQYCIFNYIENYFNQ